MNKIALLAIVLLMSGCSVKEYQLFQNDDVSLVDQSQEIDIRYESKIFPDDVLSIDIYNMNQKSNILRDSSLLGGAMAQTMDPQNRYIVAADGTIYLPLLEEVNVQGLTVTQLSAKLMDAYKRYLKQPYVKIAIKSHKVYVLGEVQKQGLVSIQGNTISVIEAIAQSGGLTDHAMRDRVHIVSKLNGKYKIRTLDLQQLSTLNMDNIMLKHDSIVYVEPRDSKAFKVGVQDYLPIIQVISSLASTMLSIDYISSK